MSNHREATASPTYGAGSASTASARACPAQDARSSSAAARGRKRPPLTRLARSCSVGTASRSRDFDTVYRHGRSVSTRFLVLYCSSTTKASLGSGLPCRRIRYGWSGTAKRRLRELARSPERALRP